MTTKERIYQLLRDNPERKMSAPELASALHLGQTVRARVAARTLVSAGLLNREQQGNKVLYSYNLRLRGQK